MPKLTVGGTPAPKKADPPTNPVDGKTLRIQATPDAVPVKPATLTAIKAALNPTPTLADLQKELDDLKAIKRGINQSSPNYWDVVDQITTLKDKIWDMKQAARDAVYERHHTEQIAAFALLTTQVSFLKDEMRNLASGLNVLTVWANAQMKEVLKLPTAGSIDTTPTNPDEGEPQ